MTRASNPANPEQREPARGEPTALQRAVAALEKMKARLEAVERAASEPIAIVGMSCRIPGGGEGPEAFWHTLENGIDAVREIPPSRFVITDERPEARWAALLDDLSLFDAGFFGISPREAETLDPQQRMLLEVAWEALENAGQRPDLLFGSRVGVFLGIASIDYQFLVGEAREGRYDAYCATGNTCNTAAGRISFALGFQGPAISVDTACSSSLVAITLACQSLRAGESKIALAAGVNALLSPRTMAMVLSTQALSPDGRCKALDARANGFVRGEGCAMVVLKRLSDALHDGDHIHGVIRGWAVNQDGRSTGLTTPNVLSQQAMLRQALGHAKLTPADIGFIEMHGTGTSLGDPIEAEALLEVLGAPRQDGSSCFLGAVKTNIGHLEGAAGVAGLLKVLLSLEHEKIPKNLHFKRLNPRVSFDGTPFVVPTENIAWPRGDKPRRAGVSAFGISGTNAHIILEEAPLTEAKAAPKEEASYLLPLSAKTVPALAALAQSYAEWLSRPNPDLLHDIVYTATMRRALLDHRLAVVARSREEFVNALTTFVQHKTAAGVVQGHASAQDTARIAFVFPGQGSQWIGMGRQLLAEEPVFRDALHVCDTAIRNEAGFSVLEEIAADEARSRIAEIDVVQPVLFALEVALASLWRSWGVEPDCVIGHSMGEVAAAHIAGMLSLEDAASVICRRSRLLKRIRDRGAMALVELTMAEAEAALIGYEAHLGVAASNGPRWTVLSGDPQALEQVLAALESKGVFCRRIKVDVASHSPQVDPLLPELVQTLSGVKPGAGTLTMHSTVTGEALQGFELNASYWASNLRQPVRLSQVTQHLIGDGYRIFIEMSPHPVLLPSIDESLKASAVSGAAIASMRRQTDERQTMLEALGSLYVHGGKVNWDKRFPDRGRVVALPAYPWQRERYWIEEPVAKPAATRASDTRVDDSFYAVEWRQISAHQQAPKFDRFHGAWLVFMDEAGTAESLVARLEAYGQTCIKVRPGKQLAQTGPRSYTLNVQAREEFSALLGHVFADGKRCAGIVYLFAGGDAPADPFNEPAVLDAQQFGFLGLTYLLQAVLGSGNELPPVWAATRGVISIAGEPITSPVHAPIWGLGRTVDLEHPELRCKRIDLDANISSADGDTLLREIATDDTELQVAIRQGQRYAARIVRAPITETSAGTPAMSAQATYLVTGGLGGLGLSVAGWLVRAGARHLVLLGRNAPSEEAQNAIRQMEATGARVVAWRADVSKRDDVAAVFAKMAAEMPPLRGIIHAAGVAENPVPILDTRRDTFDRMIASKVRGTCNLHALAKDSKLDFFILYSSASAVIGLVGQASYGGANAFMDAMALWAGARGTKNISIQWGAFAQAGKLGDDDSSRKRLAGAGMDALTPEEGLTAVSRLLQQPRPNMAVMAFSVGNLQRLFPHIAQLQYFSELQPNRGQTQSTTAAAASPPAGIIQELSAAPEDRRYELLEAHMLRRIGEVLRLDPSRIDRAAPFSSVGMDSLMSLELRNRLQPDFNLTLPATMLFAYPTPKALITHIYDRLGLAEKPQPAKPAPIESPNRDLRPIPPPPPPPPPARTAKSPAKQTAVDEMEARLAAKLASLDKYFDDE